MGYPYIGLNSLYSSAQKTPVRGFPENSPYPLLPDVQKTRLSAGSGGDVGETIIRCGEVASV
jgi:hypothetical protein